MTVYRGVMLAMALLVTIVGIQNSEAVTVDFLFWKASMSLVILLAITATLGMGLGLFVAHVRRRKPSALSDGLPH